MRRTHVAMWAGALLAVVILTALVVGAPGNNTSPLDPTSTAPDGTKALALLLRALGSNVVTGRTVPPTPGGTALLLTDQLNDTDRSHLISWVDSGGRLIVADPGSGLAGVTTDVSRRDLFLGRAPIVVGRNCAIPALQSVGSVQPDGDILLHRPPRDAGCFGAGDGFLLVARDQGQGAVVVVGGPSLWVNANLGHAGNSVLAASLLAPTPGTDVTFVGASRVGGGNKGLLALISPRVIEALWGVALAFVVVILWRARRLGRPVMEVLPVELPGSGLVEATGNLLQESGQRARAASILRRDLKRLITDRFGADPRLAPSEAAEIASGRTGLAVERFEEVLGGPTPADDRDLVVLAHSVQEIRREILNAQ
jgi:hypothetical protein